MRLIDADSIQEELAVMILYLACTPKGECIEYAHDLIDAQPTIDAEPVKHGKWIKEKHTIFGREIFTCSNCGNSLDFSGVNAGRGSANYCPNCGALMDGEVERRNNNEQH